MIGIVYALPLLALLRNPDGSMTLFEHLREFQTRLFRAVLGIAAASGAKVSAVKATEPPGEALPNSEIFRRIAGALKGARVLALGMAYKADLPDFLRGSALPERRSDFLRLLGRLGVEPLAQTV